MYKSRYQIEREAERAFNRNPYRAENPYREYGCSYDEERAHRDFDDAYRAEQRREERRQEEREQEEQEAQRRERDRRYQREQEEQAAAQEAEYQREQEEQYAEDMAAVEAAQLAGIGDYGKGK